MKKMISFVLAAALLLALAGCAGKTNEPEKMSTLEANSVSKGDQETTASQNEEIQVALLICAGGDLDDRGFNTDAWKAINRYCDENGLKCGYYMPSESTVEMDLAACDAAVKAGAKFIVVCSGMFQVSLLEMSKAYPDVKFLSIEATPQSTDGQIEILDNVKVINFSAEQSGYMAGYACVKDGYKNLGVLCATALPGIIQYGYGFIAGCDAAATEMGADDVTLKYMYLPGALSPDRQTTAAAWYQAGTEVIFTVAGPGNLSVFAAAEQNNGLCVGCDSDQSAESDTVILSALKDLDSVCYNTLVDWGNGAFAGGEVFLLGAADHATGLANASSKLANFSQSEYDTLFRKIAENVDGIADSIPNDRTCESPEQITIQSITLDYVN